ncbi:MipA/OmpV family protein [Collimonas sp.]|jgi:outer membrane protein|uniref:MipA/OmpV family protein n=1 Tax=Collimonas sp. TaxID=1963772 RepID=UPI002C6E6C02|nr:MipA/OmpV family protein [Collimonas sp.]HWW06829.1 MipA/OmpV family protein [Collimonas sp.]
MHQFKFSYRLALAAAIGMALGAVTTLCCAETAVVEEAHPVDASQWGLGVGVSSESRPYRGVSNHTRVLPLVLYESRWIHFFGNTIDFKLATVDQFSFTLRAKYALGDGYKSSDSPTLRGMDERKGSIWGGATASWDNPYARLSLEWLTAGSTKGNTVQLGIEHGFAMGRFKLTPHLSATWMDSKYVGYYYGVKPNEVIAGRAAYTGKSTSNIAFGVRADYALTPNQLIFLDVGDLQRGTGIKDSPLVDKSSALTARVGYLYKF